MWTLRVPGSGIGGVMVQGRSAVAIDSIEFAPAGTTFSFAPAPGVENTVRISVSGVATEVEASLVDASFRQVMALPLSAGPAPGSYLSRFTPGTEGLRLRVTGKDADGNAFQRVHAPLITVRR